MTTITFSKRTVDVLVILLLFVLTMSVRLYDLNGAGGTFDETDYLRNAVNMIVAFERGDFSKERWALNAEHPPIGKYVHALFFYPFVRTMSDEEKDAVINGAYIFSDPVGVSGEIYRWGRYASVLYGGLTVVLVYLFCLVFLNRRTGMIAGSMLAVLPNFIPYHKIASLDAPTSFFFTMGAVVFALAIHFDTWKWWIALGIVSGLAIATKFNLALLFVLYCLVFLAWKYREAFLVRMKDADIGKRLRHVFKTLWYWKLFFVPVIALVVLYVVWPWLWPAPIERLLIGMGNSVTGDANMETWFGQMAPVNFFYTYYFIYFLFTTPVLMLVLWAVGMYAQWKQKTFWNLFAVLWFVTPFVWMFSPQKADGMRYLTMIYPPLAILAAQGLQHACRTQKRLLYGTLIMFVYLGALSAWIHPYYLDYYNSLIGGPKNVQEKNLLEFDWFAEGKKEAVEWLNAHAEPGSVIGAKWDPQDEFGGWRSDLRAYNLIGMKYAGEPDYIMMNHRYTQYNEKNDVVKMNVSNYDLVHTIQAGNGAVGWIYKKVARQND